MCGLHSLLRSGSMLSTGRTALNLRFAGRGPETSEVIPRQPHFQIHRKGCEGWPGYPASFLSKLVIHPTIPRGIPLSPSAPHHPGPLHSPCREDFLSLCLCSSDQTTIHSTSIQKLTRRAWPLWLPWQSQKAGLLPPWNSRHPAQRKGNSTCVRPACGPREMAV